MTSSTKPEVHNVLYGRQGIIDRRLLVTCTGNFVKFGHVIKYFEICEQTERQADSHTDRLIAILRISAGEEVKIKSNRTLMKAGRPQRSTIIETV